MTAYDIAEHLVKVPGAERAHALLELVPGLAVYRVRNRRGRVGRNLILGAEQPRLVIGAHHDIDPGTIQGATDNTAAVAVLVALAARYAESGGLPPDLALCFWDFEEPGNGGFADGSFAYARRLQTAGVRPDLVVVCDVFGLGVPWLSTRSDPVSAHLVRRVFDRLALPAGWMPTPGSDDVGFARAEIPSALLTTLPANGDRSGWRVMHTREDTIDMVDPASLEGCEAGLHGLVEEYLVRGVRSTDLANEPGFAEALTDRVARERRRSYERVRAVLGDQVRPPAEPTGQLGLFDPPEAPVAPDAREISVTATTPDGSLTAALAPDARDLTESPGNRPASAPHVPPRRSGRAR